MMERIVALCDVLYARDKLAAFVQYTACIQLQRQPSVMLSSSCESVTLTHAVELQPIIGFDNVLNSLDRSALITTQWRLSSSRHKFNYHKLRL